MTIDDIPPRAGQGTTRPAAIILAAGKGTRMGSSRPKALQPIAGRSMLHHLLDACAGVFSRIVIVAGPDMPSLEAAAGQYPVVIQHERLGTGHAALQAASLLRDYDGDVAVLYADNPLITADTLQHLVDRRQDCDLALLAMRPADPGRYGRVIRDADGHVDRIVEWADATGWERAEGLCNAGVVCAPAAALFGWLDRVGNANSKGEFYLTDIVRLARADSGRVLAIEAPADELRGVNSRAELADAEATVQRRLRRLAMEGGATLMAPDTVFFSFDTQLGADVVVEPHVVFGVDVRVASGAIIRAFSHLEGCEVRPGAVIGPYARLRPGTVVDSNAHVGNFVELKATHLGEGAKANHLSYLGDCTVGARSNIGAGTITCNYDGVRKTRTTIGSGSFIGSNTALVAPVSVGDRALVAAGSVVTDDIPADAMALARARQVNKPGRGFKGKGTV